MKKVSLALALCIITFIGAWGQTIIQNNKFWDGKYLYVAKVQKAGIVELEGMDINGTHSTLKLKKDAKRKGEYILQKGNGDAPYGCHWGSRVRYIRQSGMYFLAFYVEEHTIGQTLVLTPDNIVNCTNQQRRVENECDPMSIVSDWLMNQHYFLSISNNDLKYLANHLQAIKHRTVIEQTNLQLISYAIAMGVGEDGEDTCKEELEAQPLNPEMEKIITVSNEREFVTALGSNRTIRIADGTTIYLSNLLNEREFFEVPGRDWRSDYYEERGSSDELVVSSSRFDGRQLELTNMHNLTIKGGKNCHIIVAPRYACVLNFYDCTNIKVQNLTLGHTEEGYCEGCVIYAQGCEAINISDCDLYGCGTYGLEASQCHGLVMERTIIRDCSYGIMQLRGCQYFTFRNCDFYRCRDFGLIDADHACPFLRFEACRFAQNYGALFANRSEIILDGCEIYHIDNIGSGAELIKYEGKKTTWEEYDSPLSKRIIGPSK